VSESDGEAIVIAWEVDAVRCVVGASQGQWTVSIEQDHQLVARSVFRTSTEALAEAERQRSMFSRESHQRKP
jgi:hypothetical protein